MLEENDPREVEKVITNIERTLDAMKRHSLNCKKIKFMRESLSFHSQLYKLIYTIDHKKRDI